MTEIPLPEPLTKEQLIVLARAVIRGETYVPMSEQDPRLSTLLRIVLKFIHDNIVEGHSKDEWERFQDRILFVVNPRLDQATIIPVSDARIVLRSDWEKVNKLVRPLMDFPGVDHAKAQESGYG